ncbi:MAG TPA: phosphatase PAP2 family protein [Ignavibacteriaceae bacterium]|nr:phosphatase PAP2 family protein [Ignavibacteriaceae bacterium]
MNVLKSFLYKLKAFDLVVVVFYIFLIILNLVFHNEVTNWLLWDMVNLLIIVLAITIAFFEFKHDNRFWRIMHYWYIAPIILLTFKELYYLVEPIRQHDYDWLFIRIDRWMFGGDPAAYLIKYSFPLLTEILQIVYSMFYLLPIILGLAFLRDKRYLELDYAVFSIIYGFYLSYLGYFALPGIGPRFTLHHFSFLNQKLPGLWLTPYLRDFIDAGESIPAGTANPAALVQRDVFPSGHTMITLIIMYLSVKLKSRSRYFFIPIGTLLIFATVYLWYHYVIDLIAGLAFMIFSIWTGRYIFNWWQRQLGKEEFNYDQYKKPNK